MTPGLKMFGGIIVKGIYLTENAGVIDRVYSKETQEKIAALVDMSAGWANREKVLANKEAYADVDIVFSTWSCPKFNEELLDVFKNLKIVLYGAGSLKSVVSDAFWNRGVRVCSAQGSKCRTRCPLYRGTSIIQPETGLVLHGQFQTKQKRGIQDNDVKG